MLYRICDQLVILVRFRHLNGNLKLAGLGNEIDLWGMSWWHATLAVSGRWGWFTVTCHGDAWLVRGDRIDLWGHAMVTRITGWIGAIWDWIMGYVTLAGSGGWNCFMGTCDTGWNGAMGLIYGGVWHWLNRVMGLIQGGLPWGHTTLAGSGWWDWFMGVCRGACNTGWIGAMGLIYGIHHGHATGLGKWDWFEGARHWGVTLAGTRHGGATGSKRWDWFVGARHGGATLAGCKWWDWFMGVFHGSAQLDRAMELICGGELWGRMTLARSGWGVDLCGHVMRAHDTGWIGVMELIHGGVLNDKVLYGCWIWMTIPCVLCLALR